VKSTASRPRSSCESCPNLREDCFALKGGMGIKLFIRDMPRGYQEMAGLLFYSRY
jgi:hypothetical protein